MAGVFGTRVMLRLLNMLMLVLLARLLGPVGQGRFSFILMGALLLSGVAQMGLDISAVYFIRSRNVSQRRVRHGAFRVLLGSSTTLVALVAVANHLELLPVLAPLDEGLLLLGALLVFNEVLGLFLRSLLIAEEQFRRLNLLDLAQGVLQIMLVAVVVWIHPSAQSALLAYLLARVVGTMIALVLTRDSTFGEHDINLKELLAYARFPWATNLLSMLNVRLDTLMLGWFLGLGMGVRAEDIGLYTVCALAINALREMQLALQKVFLPRVSTLGTEDAASLTCRLYRFSFLAYAGITMGVVLLGYPALLLFGPEYGKAWLTLVVLTIGTVLIRANGGLLSLFLTTHGHPGLPTVLNGLGVLVNLGLNILFIPHAGILGAAMATALTAMLVKLGFIVAYCRITATSYRKQMILRRADFRVLLGVVKRKDLNHAISS